MDEKKLQALIQMLIDKSDNAKEAKGNVDSDTLISSVMKFGKWLGSSAIMAKAVDTIRNMSKQVYALDTSLQELSKVSNLSANELKQVTKEAYKLGNTVAKTGTQVLDATTLFKRAGYDIADSMKYAEETLKTTNISNNLKNAGTAAEYLINIMKGFQEETPEFASHIIDAISEVSNSESIDFDRLVEGSEQLSAVANQAGLSFDQMLGTLTGAYELLGNMETVASGQIAIFTKLQALQTDSEDSVSTIAKLQETFSNATNGTINIIDHTSGELRNVYDILDDLSQVWNTLDKNTQDSLALEAAGNDQSSVFLAMMNNWQGVEDAVKSATNSMGAADIENQKYLDSLAGHVDEFETAMEHLSQTLISSDVLKILVEWGTQGVKALDALADAMTPLGVAGAAGTGLLAAFNKDRSKQRFCPSWA